MYCKSCGKELPDNAAFCIHCGTATDSNNDKDQKSNKCPNCGGLLASFENKCKFCGHEIISDIPSSVKEFELKIVEISNMPEKKQSIWRSGYVTEKTNKIANLIKNYAIPNNPADIMDFMILAVSNIDPSAYDEINNTPEKINNRVTNDAWISKYEQALQKALMIMGRNENIDRIEALFKEKQIKIKKEKRKTPIFLFILFAGIILILALMYSKI